MRIDPAASEPWCSAPMNAPAAAAAPPDDPPGVRSGFHGFRVMPVNGLSVTPFQPNSGVVVLPISPAPASRRRAVAGAYSSPGPAGSPVFEPRMVGQALARVRALQQEERRVGQEVVSQCGFMWRPSVDKKKN